MQATLGVSIAVRTVLGSAHAVFLTPGVNRGGTPPERMAWASEFQSTLCLLAAITVPLLLLFPQVAVRVLYSAQFAPGARFVALFVFAEFLGLLAATYQAIVVAFDHLVFHVVQNIAAQLLLVAIAAPLIDSHGILGAGIAALSAQAVLYAATTTFLWWRYRIKMPARTAALTAFALTACLATGAAGVMWPALSVSAIALKLLAYVVIVGLLLAVLSPDDRQRLFRVAGRLRLRLQPANS
jgi:O-antigen/teichoic acid export membrane protein